MVSFPTRPLFSWIQYPVFTEQEAGRVVCTAGVDTLEKRESLAHPGSK